MKEPVDHVLRPGVPWRHGYGEITECGYDATKVKTITREQYFQRVKDMGQKRAAMFMCMTCADTAKRWGTWDDDPRLGMQREIEWERGGAYYQERTDRGQRLKDELLAVAALIENHREEFDASIKATEARREWIARKAHIGRARDD